MVLETFPLTIVSSPISSPYLPLLFSSQNAKRTIKLLFLSKKNSSSSSPRTVWCSCWSGTGSGPWLWPILKSFASRRLPLELTLDLLRHHTFFCFALSAAWLASAAAPPQDTPPPHRQQELKLESIHLKGADKLFYLLRFSQQNNKIPRCAWLPLSLFVPRRHDDDAT